MNTAVTQESALFARVYALVRSVPEGKVTTYGAIARQLELRDVRKVGWALHANKDHGTPCHRVVNREGRLAPNFAFGGEEEQRIRLEREGVIFLPDGKVDLVQCGWSDFGEEV